MAHARPKECGEQPKLDMTPMIDVVFQLLIFFVVALKQEDILSGLTACRPSCNDGIEHPVELINITVGARGFALNGASIPQVELERRIAQLSEISKTASVIIRCSADSPHGLLVQALDICSKHKMANLSVFSM
jgi:biopolymer transport protein ExbD